MNNEEIKNAVINYIKDSIYHYAVMVNGDWGTGKSYFVKNELIDAIEEYENSKNSQNPEYVAKKVAYISAYGIQCPSDLSEQLYATLASDFAKIGISAINIFSKLSLGKTIIETSKIVPQEKKDEKRMTTKKGKSEKKMELDLNRLLDLKSLATKLSRAIIIIDDIERSNCNINELFGYINRFIEHDGIKIILVANEKHISELSHVENQELKYLVAKSNQDIDYETDPFKINNSTQNGKISIDELDKRVEKLFITQTDYSMIKEKVVGITLNYEPEFQSIAEKLVKEHIEQDILKKYLLAEINIITSVAKAKKHQNIRTFQFFLSKMSELYSNSLEKRSDTNRLLIPLIKCYWHFCIAYKTGEMYNLGQGVYYGNFTLKDSRPYSNNNILGFKFADEHIRTGTIITGKITDILDKYISEQACKTDDSDDSANILAGGWFYMSDTSICSHLSALKDNLDHKLYAFRNYSNILRTLARIANCGFNKTFFEKIVDKMIENINNGNVWQQIPNENYGLENGEIEIYNAWRSRINDAINNMLPKSTKNSIFNALEQEYWASELLSIANSFADSSFWDYIDIEKLSEKIRTINDRNMGYLINFIYQLPVDKVIHGNLSDTEKITLRRILQAVENIPLNESNIMMNYRKTRLILLLNSLVNPPV